MGYEVRSCWCDSREDLLSNPTLMPSYVTQTPQRSGKVLPCPASGGPPRGSPPNFQISLHSRPALSPPAAPQCCTSLRSGPAYCCPGAVRNRCSDTCLHGPRALGESPAPSSWRTPSGRKPKQLCSQATWQKARTYPFFSPWFILVVNNLSFFYFNLWKSLIFYNFWSTIFPRSIIPGC